MPKLTTTKKILIALAVLVVTGLIAVAVVASRSQAPEDNSALNQSWEAQIEKVYKECESLGDAPIVGTCVANVSIGSQQYDIYKKSKDTLDTCNYTSSAGPAGGDAFAYCLKGWNARKAFLAGNKSSGNQPSKSNNSSSSAKTTADKQSIQPASNVDDCDQYKDENLNLACGSGYDLGADECERYKSDEFIQACATGVQISEDEADKPVKTKNKEKADKAAQVVKKTEKRQNAAQKAVDKAQKEVKKACDKNKDSKQCKAAQKKLDQAKKVLAATNDSLKSARALAAKLRSISSTGGCKYKTFFGIKPWYAYLGDEFSSNVAAVNAGDSCTLKCFNFLPQEGPNDCGVKHSDIPYVLLAIVDGMLRVSGLVAVIFVIVGATKYITSQGEPEAVAKAQGTVLNALIGMAIALVAIALISFVTRNIGV